MLPPQIQLYGLVFLLGSFSVASLSDLRRMAAQRDFAEVWVYFTGIVFLFDLYEFISTQSALVVFKWALIVGFAYFAWRRQTPVFNLSLMDTAAVCAVASLLNPLHIGVYYVILFAFKEILTPVLSKFGEAGAYPFLPVVFVSTLAVTAVIVYDVLEGYVITL